MMIVVLIKTVASWFVLAFIGTNMIGMIVRGFSPLFYINPEKYGHDFIKQEAVKGNRINRNITITWIILVVVFFCLLLRYLHPGIAVAAAMLMASRIPDLVWEIRHGQKFDRNNPPKGTMYIIATLLLWGALPVLFLAFYSA